MSEVVVLKPETPAPRLATRDLSARAFHASLPGYEPTPLVTAGGLATELGAGRVLIKNEQERLSLPSFKILGAAWAVHRSLCARLALPPARSFAEVTAAVTARDWILTCATDGNHGRAVARVARLLGLAAHVLVPAQLSEARVRAIEGEGAEVTAVDGSYDDAVRRAAREADEDERAIVISDTSWPGYTEVPQWVIDGYATIFEEVDDCLRASGEDPAGAIDLVVVPVGVGALAAAAARHYVDRQGVVIATVEPIEAGCVFASLRAGRRVTVPGPHPSIMAGLNCGEPSVIALPVLQAAVRAAVLVSDDEARAAMATLAGTRVEAGECGAASLAGARALLAGTHVARRLLDLDEESTVLLLNTEGATDRTSYREALAVAEVTEASGRR